MQICPHCGEENPDRFRLCGFCGTKLGPEATPEEVRRTVSVVFCDLKGSTSLGERLDSESLREVLNVYFREMQIVLERHGGTVEKFIGDAVMAVFGLPRLHEDDALRAVRAAYDMKRALERVNEELDARWGVRLENRTGVNTGEVVAGDVTRGQRLVTGDVVNVAARLEQAAPALEILIGNPTYRLVKDAVEVEPVEPLELKGKAERVPAYRLVGVAERQEGVARRLDAPMVGRQEELRILTGAMGRALERRACELVTVYGPAGVGKSRLLGEFIRVTGEGATVLRGRCLPYGDGITFWPLAEVAKNAAAISDEDPLDVARAKLDAAAEGAGPNVVDRLAAAIGLSTAVFPVQETFWAARRFFETLASRAPLIVVIDDIHWAEDVFLGLLRYVADSLADAPVLIACSSRPDLLEDQGDWAEEGANMHRVVLGPLSSWESSLVVENLLGSSALDESARARIIEAADGNPLFVEQILSMLIDDGIVARDSEGRWALVSDLGSFTIPPSISALLTARLDRLGSAERTVIERGSVMGQVFFQGGVKALVSDTLRDHVDLSLSALTRKEWIRPDETKFAGQDAFRFLHILVRDAAYYGILKRTRAELHEAFVDWLEGVASDRVTEYEEIRGYHLEQAFVIRAQLGTVDDRVRAIGVRGSGYLSAAGHRALARGDMHAAANLLERASTLLPAADSGRPQLLLQAGEALTELGEFSMAKTILEAAEKTAQELGEVALAVTADLVRLQLRYTTEAEGSEGSVMEEVERVLPILEQAGDHFGLARAWRLLTMVHATAARAGAAERAARHTIEQARLAGDRLLEVRFLSILAMCALYGPTPVPSAIRECEHVLEKAGDDRKSVALTTLVLSGLEAMEGRFDRARLMYRRSRADLEELGWKLHAALTSLISGVVEMRAGDPVAAEAELRRDYETLDQMGEKNYVSTTAGHLAEALYAQGRYDEADRFTAISEEVAAPEDVSSQFLWRSVRSKILARKGRFVDGEEMAREAVRLIRESDDVDNQANALMDLGEVLRLAGKEEDAALVVKDASGLYEQKGNVVCAEQARGLLEVRPLPSETV